MNDSGIYVGACLRRCDVVMNRMWMENNALGYSGTNSGGTIVIENSQFDDNQDGLDTNTAVVGDPPAPQDGRCPGGGLSPITRTHLLLGTDRTTTSMTTTTPPCRPRAARRPGRSAPA